MTDCALVAAASSQRDFFGHFLALTFHSFGNTILKPLVVVG